MATRPRGGEQSSSAVAPRATLAQVAERAGVSRSAAGFVLSGRRDQRIAQETWRRVEAAAEELGYRPNLTARALRTGTSGTVAMVSDYISTTSVANAMISGALRELRDRGILMFTAETLGERSAEDQVVADLLDRHVDGFIFATMFTRAVSPPAAIRERPVVLLNCVDEQGHLAAVVPDEFGAGASAARVLLDAGHRGRIHFVGTLPAGMTGAAQWHGAPPLALAERLAGARSALDPVGVELVPVDIETDWDVSNGREAVARLVAAGAVPTAIICVNDRVALGAYQALGAAGLDIPGDVSVVSFDNSPAAELMAPPLTSVALPHEEMGRAAVRLLLDHDAATGVHREPMVLESRSSIAQ